MEKRVRYRTHEFKFKAIIEEDVNKQEFDEIKSKPYNKIMALFDIKLEDSQRHMWKSKRL